MENDALIRRAEDLAERCSRTSDVTQSGFLTPAEQAEIAARLGKSADFTLVLSGGREECERKCAFFLPYYMDAESFEPAEFICGVKVKAGFGEPCHRDYMGAALALGIKREWLGDIWVDGGTAYLFCLPSVESHLLLSLDKVGRFGVKTAKTELSEMLAPVRETRTVTFNVKSMRLDAVAGGMFSVSRSEAERLISAGAVSLNHVQCMKCDANVKTGDTISLRGKGKGVIGEAGGISKKGRQFLEAEIFI